jgi:alkylresorcinol/alkylpyrone synthase
MNVEPATPTASEQAPRLVALATAVPPHVYRQEEVRAFAAHLFSDVIEGNARLIHVYEHAHIEQRHLCVTLEWLGADHGFAERNALYVQNAVALARTVAQGALDQASMQASEIDHILFVSSTGLATPSIDAHLANLIPFRPGVRRTPIWGLGCAGGAAGISRAMDLARGNPSARILVIALELCSLTFQHDDLSRQNLVAAALFADGAAAAVIVGSAVAATTASGIRPLALLASHSTFWPDTLDVMGWRVEDNGLAVVFSPEIPLVVQEKVCPDLVEFLARSGLVPDKVDHLVMHPGGTKVLRAFARALQRPPGAFRHSRAVLRDFGNMSSPTCLFVLDRFLRAGVIQAGDTGVLGAMGPGFAAEFVLFAGGEA